MEKEYYDESGPGSLRAGPSAVARKLAGVGLADSTSPKAKSAHKATWLDAWSDPVAGIRAYTPCIHTCNLYGDGDWKLVVADQDKKLKVWKDTQRLSEHALLETPVAIASVVSEAGSRSQPSLAVAAGSHIFIYRNLRPYYKFVVPPEDVNTEEQQCWSKAMAGEMSVGEVMSVLAGLQDQGALLTSRSLQLMNIGDPQTKVSFIEQWQGQPLVSTTVITCMDVMNLALDEPGAVNCLVVGTESGRVLVLNPAGTAVAKNMWLGVTPAFIAVTGELEVAYRITVAARDGKVYTFKNGELQSSMIQLEAQAVGLAALSASNIIVACMNNAVHSYKPNGQKNYTLYMPSPVLTIQKVEVYGARMSKGVVLALANGEVRLYNDKQQVLNFSLPSPVTALWFGRYGREDNTLVTVTKSGLLDIKILPRTAGLESAGSEGPPPEQDIPLQVPKKTRLYVEQTQRERESAAEMHRIFQRDLVRLKLSTARAYVRVLTDGQGASAFTSSANLSLSLSAKGLGPRFKMVITVRNDGSSQIQDLPVLIKALPHMYQVSRGQLLIPLLVPSVTYTFELDVLCVQPDKGSDSITVVLLGKGSLPVLQAQLTMPVSEPEDD